MFAARFVRTVGPMAATLMLLGCPSDDGGDGDADAAISAACMEATTHSDLAWIQDNIFTPSCAAFGSCHMGTAAVADSLNLEVGMSQANLVDVTSMEDPARELIVAGEPDSSYLLHILGREPLPGGVVIRRTMPLGNPLLCDQKTEAIARWIQSL